MYISILIQVILMEENTLQPGAEEKLKPQINNESKLDKKKVFKIAPIHHHFEQCGWEEFTIVMRFWIIGAIMAAFGTILGLINII